MPKEQNNASTLKILILKNTMMRLGWGSLSSFFRYSVQSRLLCSRWQTIFSRLDVYQLCNAKCTATLHWALRYEICEHIVQVFIITCEMDLILRSVCRMSFTDKHRRLTNTTQESALENWVLNIILHQTCFLKIILSKIPIYETFFNTFQHSWNVFMTLVCQAICMSACMSGHRFGDQPA